MKMQLLKEISSLANLNNSNFNLFDNQPLMNFNGFFIGGKPSWLYSFKALSCSESMQVSLSIIRYRKRYILFAFLAMLIFRLPLWLNKSNSFFKLLGCGKNGAFDKKPDLCQWGILTVLSSGFEVRGLKFDVRGLKEENGSLTRELHGRFISNWFRLFKCEIWTVLLEPVEGHGLWDGKKVFGVLPNNSLHEGRIAILTRATIRLSKLKYFWQNVAPVAKTMNSAKGFISSVGIGEIPWIKQATFSTWENKEDMKAFAYGMKVHSEVIKKTREQQWYSEEMFVRFKITGSMGTIHGINPLEGKS